MLIKTPGDEGPPIPSCEITPPETYFNRRSFLRGAALVGGVAATAGLFRLVGGRPKLKFNPPALYAGPEINLSSAERLARGYDVDPNEDPQTPFIDITNYNNYYEFGTDKGSVSRLAKGFVTKPWTLTVDGLVDRPQTFDLDDLQKIAPLEDRIYRHRCVEKWSMVIPWLGFPLAALLSKVGFKSNANFVAFQSFFDGKQMPDADYLPFPYHEGLRIDEAMNPLAILAFGLYGKILLPQNGAPVRLVCPWKYGFKNAKAIVRITLVKDQPTTSWNTDQPGSYGFYCNVNPDVSEPWDQSQEQRLPDMGTRPTLPFNGYAEQVAQLYKGMDLSEYF